MKDDARFCENCGTAVASNESFSSGEVSDTNSTSPVNEGGAVAVVTEQPVAIVNNTPIGNNVNNGNNVITSIGGNFFSNNKKLLMYIGGGVAAVAIVVVIIIGLVSLFSGSAKSPIVYMKDDKIIIKSAATAKEIEITDKISDHDFTEGLDVGEGSEFLHHSVFFSKDKKVMFFMDNINQDDDTADLYYAKLSKLKADSGSNDQYIVKIASDVSCESYYPYRISEDGSKVAYIKNYVEDEGGKLYISDLKDSTVVDKNVGGNFSYSTTSQKLIYFKLNDDKEMTMYVKDITSDKEAEKIDSKCDNLLTYTEDLKKIYYTKKSDEPLNNTSVYVKEEGKDAQKIIKDAQSIVSYSDIGNFFYTKATETKVNLYDLVDDNMSSDDSKLVEPKMENFQKQVEYTDYWGYTSYYTTTDYDAYNAAYDKYRDKQERDYLRQSLKDETITTNKYDLYLYSDGAEKLVTNDYSLDGGSIRSAERKSIIYYKEEKDSFKKPNLSDISSANDVKDSYQNTKKLSKNAYMVIGGNSEIELENYLMDVSISEDMKKLYGIETKDSAQSGDLVMYDIEAGKLKNRKEIESDVGYLYYYNDKEIYFFKDMKDGIGELCKIENSKAKTIASDVYAWRMRVIEDGTVLFFSDYDMDNRMGTFYMLKGEEKIKISDDVSEWSLINPNNILYISDFEEGRGGDLWQYTGKDKKEKVDEDVSGVVTDDDESSY